MEFILSMTALDKLTLGGNTMLLGIVMVFLILGLLIGLVTLIKFCMAKSAELKEKKKAKKNNDAPAKEVASAPVVAVPVSNDAEVVAAITAAISMYYEVQSASIGKSVKFKVRSIKEIR